MKSFQSKVVVITGAGSGIGRALAVHFASLGARLALNDFQQEGLAGTAALLPEGADAMQAVFDVADREAMFRFAEEVHAWHGRVDVVVNNAGVAIAGLRTDAVTVADYEWLLGINLWGMVYGSLAFLPHLRAQPESALVNVSSIFGLHGIPGQSPYVTSKFAIRGFTESLAIEEAAHGSGVTVSCVHPGGVRTNIARAAKGAEAAPEAIDRFEQHLRTSPERAAAVIVRGIRRKRTRILVGPDAHLFHFAAHRLRWVLRRFLQRGYRRMLDGR